MNFKRLNIDKIEKYLFMTSFAIKLYEYSFFCDFYFKYNEFLFIIL